MILIILHLGWTSVVAIFLSCFFMSIMYPTIFALGIRGLGEAHQARIFPDRHGHRRRRRAALRHGLAAQTYGVRYGFLMPLACFIYIALYAAFWPALEKLDTGHEVAD